MRYQFILAVKCSGKLVKPTQTDERLVFSRKDAACYKYKFCTNLGRFFLPLGASITAVSGSSGSSKGSSSDRHFLFRFLSSDTIRFITFRFIRLTFLLGR